MRIFLAFLICLLAGNASAMMGLMVGDEVSGPDVTAPEVPSATINGTAVVLNFSEAVTRGTNYLDSYWNIDGGTMGNDVGLTYVNGDGTASWSMTAATAAVESEVIDLDFVPGVTADIVEDGAGNDLAAITSLAMTNNTTTEDSCTGSLVATWHMEDLDLANEIGCSTLGDTTWEAFSGATLWTTSISEGAKAGHGADNLDYHFSSITQNFPINEGTIWLDVNIFDYATNAIFWTVNYDANNYIDLAMINGSGVIDIRARYTGNATISTLNANTNINEANGVWYRIKYQWKVSATTADHRMDVWQLDASNPRQVTGSPVTIGPEDDLTALTSAPTTHKIGMTTDAVGGLDYDNFKMYNTSDL